MNKLHSIIRTHEYRLLRNMSFSGEVLDIGGNKDSDYHTFLSSANKIVTANINPSGGCDLVFDIQKPFPLGSNSFDTVVSMNVLEHIFDFHPVFSEVRRVLKPGGTFVSSTPFMFHIHACPDDYFRYTESALRELAKKHDFEVEKIEVLGYGIFSLLWQTTGNVIPTSTLKYLFQMLSVKLDCLLLNFSIFRKLRSRIPLGYFWVFKKTSK